MEAYEGQRILAKTKFKKWRVNGNRCPKIQWHMIGHVQTNKVKFMAPFVNLIHGVDSFKLLKEINKQALKNDRIIDCLLQMHIAEETKFGLDEEELNSIMASSEFQEMKTYELRVNGNGNDKRSSKKRIFATKINFDKLKLQKTENCQLDTLSMGMSGDYQLAIECGYNDSNRK
jgi:uncharacterized pyridoxal phosphate-containing UPF0001 family protein